VDGSRIIEISETTVMANDESAKEFGRKIIKALINGGADMILKKINREREKKRQRKGNKEKIEKMNVGIRQP
jgi:hypothetical protein